MKENIYITAFKTKNKQSKQNMFKFIELLNTTNRNYLHKLCVYIFHAFKLRTDKLYRNPLRN